MGSHHIKIVSLQRYHGDFDASFVNDNGTLDSLAMDLEFQEEVKLTFECDCGKKFRKQRTAVEHLQKVSIDQ